MSKLKQANFNFGFFLGFDDQGRQYDKDGVLYNDDKNGLWSEQ